MWNTCWAEVSEAKATQHNTTQHKHSILKETTMSKTLKPEFPAWLEEISPADISAILEGGCYSWAYLPAVTYWQVLETMHKHGDEVLQFLRDHLDETPPPPAYYSWAQRACYYLASAVELWCQCHEELADWDREDWN